MPSEKTRADSLREYLTGATSDGAAQADPDASLGNYRSSSEAESLDIVVTNALSGITVSYAGGGNTLGDGTLNAVDTGTVQWKCASGSYGASVSISDGETKIAESLGSPGAYLRISRSGAVSMSGAATVTLTQKMNNLFALDDVSSAEATAGDIEYRGTMVVNESSATITALKRYVGQLGTARISDVTQLDSGAGSGSGSGTSTSSGAGTIVTTGSLADWPESGFCHIKNGATTREIVYYSERTATTLTVPDAGRGLLGTSEAAGDAADTIHAVPGIALAIDTDGVTVGGAAIQTIATEGDAPTTVTWDTGITAATGLQIGDMEADEQVGIWIKRQVPAGAVATTEADVIIEDSFDAA